MSYPNSPFDPEIEVWGWPWHGMIDGNSEQNGTLHLPSGATMPCRYPGFNDTYLWDIGLPHPNLESDNPDEQWLSRAIVRGRGFSGAVAWYGGASSGGYPIHVPGAGTLSRITTVSFRLFNGVRSLNVQCTINGRGSIVRQFSLEQMGLAGVFEATGQEVDYVDCERMDESPDGSRTLYRLMPRLSGQVSNLFGRAIIELAYSVGATTFDFSVTVLRRFGDYSAEFTTDVNTQADLDARRVVIWVRGSESVERMKSDGPPPGEGWTATASWSRGSRTDVTEYSVPIWAWYVGGVPQIVQFTQAHSLSVTAAGGYSTRSMTTRAEVVTRLSAGGNAVSLTTRVEQAATSDDNTTHGTATYFAENEQLYQTSSTANGYIDPFTTFTPSGPVDSPSDITRDATISLSNKLIAPRLLRVAHAEPDPNPEVWVGGALYPGGSDPSLHRIASTDPNYLGGMWSRGAYNPLTGAVVRHVDKYCSWV
ncbi:hypothetical protein [Pseudomonas kuykendallii]|uniref:hypothetical protein n=1 Tax=Pseudomonas kuykendallii TaxID=1007099 RepID=UPI0028D20690|nr:hypothetical protein [Pseudomonas kuykendallii]